jgi:hypothetical protein
MYHSPIMLYMFGLGYYQISENFSGLKFKNDSVSDFIDGFEGKKLSIGDKYSDCRFTLKMTVYAGIN